MPDLTDIKLKVRIEDLAEKLGIHLASDGDRYAKAVCPFHNDTDPSFVINKITQTARCFSSSCVANRTLDHIGLIRVANHLSEDEAVDFLYGVVGEPRPADTLSDHLRRVMSRLHQNIGEEIPRMFFEGRGIGVEALKDLMVGYSPSYAWFNEAKADVPIDAQVRLELVNAHLFNNAIIYPQFDGTGKICGFRSRPFAAAQKYYSNGRDFPLKASRLYGLHLVKGTQLILVEGPNDVLSLRSAGIKNVVGLNGNKTKDLEKFLNERGFSDIVFIADGEDAGKIAIMNTPAMFRVNQIPNGLDPDELIVKEGLLGIMKLVSEARFPFQIRYAPRLANVGKDLASKVIAIKSIAREISEGLPRIVLSVVQKDIADALTMSPEDVMSVFELVDFDTSNMEYKIVSHVAMSGPMAEDIKLRILPWMMADPIPRHQFEDLLKGLSLSEHITDKGTLTSGDVDQFVDRAKRRRLKNSLTRSLSEVMNVGESLDDAIGAIMGRIYDVSYEGVRVMDSRELLEIGVQSAIMRHNNQDRLLGLSFGAGFPKSNEILQGLRPKSFYVMAATQGTGKSMLALEWALDMAYRQNIPVLWISLEMSELDISNRILSKITAVPAKLMMSGKTTTEELAKMATTAPEFGGKPLYMVNTGSISVSQIVALVRKMKQTKGIQAVFLDYLQLIRGSSSASTNSYERLGAISGDIKNLIALDHDLGLPVVAIAQLNRQAIKMSAPVAEYIAESYRIAQDADVIITLKKRSPEEQLEDNKTGVNYGNLLMHIDKNRSGEDKVKLGLLFNRGDLTIKEVDT